MRPEHVGSAGYRPARHALRSHLDQRTADIRYVHHRQPRAALSALLGLRNPGSPGTGTCDRGPRAGLDCTTTSINGLTRDCPTGGADGTHPCTPGGGNCLDGSHVGPISVNLSPLTTGTANKTTGTGLFCPGQGPAAGPGHLAGCFGSAACTSITENGVPYAFGITPGNPAPATLASVFCVAATGNGLVDASADLPGPGAVSLPGFMLAH